MIVLWFARLRYTRVHLIKDGALKGFLTIFEVTVHVLGIFYGVQLLP